MRTFTCDAVIFDLDGVLVDSSECVERLWREWAARHSVDWETVVRVAPGRRTAEAIALVAPHLDADAEAVALSRVEATDTDGVHPVAGAQELLAVLGAGGWAVATSALIYVLIVHLGRTLLTLILLFLQETFHNIAYWCLVYCRLKAPHEHNFQFQAFSHYQRKIQIYYPW